MVDDIRDNPGSGSSDCALCASRSVEGSQQIVSNMANAYVDFDLGDGWQFYLGGGIGEAEVEADYEFLPLHLFSLEVRSQSFFEDSDTVPVQQLRIGWAYETYNAFHGYFGVRFVESDDIELRSGGRSVKQEGVSARMLEAGFRYQF